MSATYEKMWQDLGLDLAAHDQLLSALGQAYRQIFLTQSDRPKGMDYFNFVMSEVHGLRIQELLEGKAAGRKVVGAFCVFVPEEIVRAAGATQVGLCTGADFASDKVDKYLPRNTCALIRSAFGFKLGRVCPYVESADLIVGENTCDGKKKSYEILGDLVPKLYVMDLPQVKSAAGRTLLAEEYRRFKAKMEELTGANIDAPALRQAIALTNAKRRAVLRLARLRAHDPAPISGLDALLINQVFFYDDPVRFTAQVNQLCDELEERVKAGQGVAKPGAPRVLVSGCPMAVPNWKLPALIESCGGVIVGEESCVGERGTRHLTAEDGQGLEDLLAAVVDRYFKIDCAIFTPNPDRLAQVKEMAQAYRADGVIHYGLNFCQPYQMEAVNVEKELRAAGIPCLSLSTDYSEQDAGQLKTRVEAFLEMIQARPACEHI